MNEILKKIPASWQPLTTEFFSRPAPDVAADLLTCILLRKTIDGWMGGPISETEAYSQDDPASHSFRGPTLSNKSMFALPSTVYVYRSYGIHYCLNFSTGSKDKGEAVLIRALNATYGREAMRPGASLIREKLCSGPGRLCAALGIDKSLDGQLVGEGDLSLWRTERKDQEDFLKATGVRIGISKAIDLNWRFGIAGHPSLSKPFRKDPGSRAADK